MSSETKGWVGSTEHRGVDVGLSIAAQGMLAEQVRQDQLSNDLANANTAGYKPDTSVQSSFGDLLLANSSTGQTIGTLQTGTTISQVVTDLSPGPLKSTGQPLDFGIGGTGFFAVRTAQGVRYTRDGQFSASPQGLLVDRQGNPVLSQTGATVPVGANGTVPASALGVFNVTGTQKQGDNLFTGTAAGRASGTAESGMLEGSGADPIHTMVEMIGSLRDYQSGQQTIQAIDHTLQLAASDVGSLGGKG
jgi:flagellar basal-body rod protein FlgF